MAYQIIQQFSHMLVSLSGLLDKAQGFAEQRKYDVSLLLNARLAPDQFPLSKQIQATCDAAKLAAARLAGQEAPKHPDTEQNLAEFKARIEHTLDYLRSFAPEDFADGDTRQIVLPFIPDKYSYGHEYLHSFAVPNFYFHLSMAYAILRSSGVEIGKTDYITYLPLKPLES
ncbi:MAG: DUF1993 domain-containing protein [Candidatus Melainabacteria bacterium HGW-Melainabacteria-1]|nr:MAG: DUF1993 domain-containing protein [Candidatus Melainabacteria bacterium HGW-Melainabacteria-1]